MPVIGREPPADLVVPAPQVSARHAEIRHLGGDLYSLVDLGSSNGTFVNDRRIQSATVRVGDRIRLGTCPFELASYLSQIPWVAPLPASPMPAPASLPQPPAAPPAASLPSAPPATPAPIPTAQQVGQWQQPGLGTELAAALAAQKSFTGRAFLVWFLYWLFWIPGFVMNLVWMNEAGRIKKMTGRSPSGAGCLAFLFVVHVVLPALAILVLVLTGGALLGQLRSLLR